MTRLATLRGRDTTVSQHGGGMRAVFTVADTLDTSKREGRCLGRNIHLICPNKIRFGLEKGCTIARRELTPFAKCLQPILHFLR